MRVWRNLRLTLTSPIILLLGLAACLTMLALPAHATDATVVCPGGSGVGFPSITAALGAIGQTGPSTITVTGTCQENVSIFQAQLITIVAGPGGAKIVGPLDNDAVDITQSQNITLLNLDIGGTFSNTGLGGGGGVSVSGSTGVQIFGCTIHDNQAVGVDADTGSVVDIRRTTIQNNTPGDGLDVFDGSTVILRRTTIQNNADVQAGTVGVFISRESDVVLQGGNLIQNNATIGIVVRLVSTLVFGGAPNTVQGHQANGIVVQGGSHLQVNNASVVQGNGAACPQDPMCGGISATQNSTVEMPSGTVTDNQGSGISVQQGTNLHLAGATVSNNTGDGVRIQRISIGDFSPGNNITGNGRFNIFCDARSLGLGNLRDFSKVRCGEE